MTDPFAHKAITNLPYARNISLSPDGKRLFLTYLADTVPDEWRKNPFVHLVGNQIALFETMILYDLDTRQSYLAFKNVVSFNTPVWSSDSQSFYLNTHSPIGSTWEADDIRDDRISPKDVNLFKVNAESGSVEEVFRGVPDVSDHSGPLFLLPNGGVPAADGILMANTLHFIRKQQALLKRLLSVTNCVSVMRTASCPVLGEGA